MWSMLQALLALGLVVGLLVFLGRAARGRRSLLGDRGVGPIRVGQRISLAPKASLFVIEAGDRQILVGLAGSQMRLIAELPAGEAVNQISPEIIDLSHSTDPESELFDTWGVSRPAVPGESIFAGLKRLVVRDKS